MYLPCVVILSASIDLLPEWLNPIIGSDKEPIRTLLESYEIWWWSGCFFLCSLKKLKEFTLLLPTVTSQCALMTPVPLITETLNAPMVYIDLYKYDGITILHFPSLISRSNGVELGKFFRQHKSRSVLYILKVSLDSKLP